MRKPSSPPLSLLKTDSMLPAVVKLCCGISYPHLRNMAGLQRAAVAVIGQEITHLQGWGWIQHPTRAPAEFRYNEPGHEAVNQMKDQLFYVKKGQEALRKAVKVLESKEGWKVEITESNGDVIYSKVMPGGGRVFRLESVLEADVDELYDILFLRVEEMHTWNPSIQQIKVLKHVGSETVVTHEVSAQTAGNLIGQRDFLCVRHSRKHKSDVYLSGVAIQLESFPPLAGFVRAEDGPSCILIRALGARKTHFTWLLNMDVKVITQTRGVGHLPDALLLISSPNFDICLSVDPRLNSQLSCTRVAYVTLETGVLISRAGCQNPLSIRLCPEHSWILPNICGDISQRLPAQGDSALLLTEEPGKAKQTLEEISL